MFVPSSVKSFGSAFTDIKLSGKCNDVLQRLSVQRTHWKYLDKPSHRCGNEDNPNTTSCIVEHIQDKIGCRVNIQGIKSLRNRSLCNSKLQFDKLYNLSHALEEAHDTSIYEMTGCMSSCEKDKFELIQVARSRPTKPVQQYCKALVSIQIDDKSFIEEEQYYVYTFNNFIADVGGYMGLLLGSSILSIYDEIENYLNRKKLGSFFRMG